jgi:hypothetical protein
MSQTYDREYLPKHLRQRFSGGIWKRPAKLKLSSAIASTLQQFSWDIDGQE